MGERERGHRPGGARRSGLLECETSARGAEAGEMRVRESHGANKMTDWPEPSSENVSHRGLQRRALCRYLLRACGLR